MTTHSTSFHRSNRDASRPTGESQTLIRDAQRATEQARGAFRYGIAQ